jgi:hypothetical protein
VIRDRLRVARKPGYAGIDAFVFLLLSFTARPGLGGLRGFGEDHAAWAPAPGALAARERLMSASALSRLLDAASVDELRGVGRWLLREASGAMDVLRSPAVQARDARGEGWHVFDYDPTREAFRRRDLAGGNERPDAVRRAAKPASPGHRGAASAASGALAGHAHPLGRRGLARRDCRGRERRCPWATGVGARSDRGGV